MDKPQRIGQSQIANLIAQGYREKYGKWWAPVGGRPILDLTLELEAFRIGLEVPQAPGKAQHFRNIVNAIWNTNRSNKKFIFHPWADRMLEAACKHKFLGIAGCASSGKTDFFAMWAIVNFLAAPSLTTVLVTSTSLKDSRKRVWGSIESYWQV